MLLTTEWKKRAKKAFMLSLGFMLVMQVLLIAPSPASAAVTPLPSPSNPINYEDFNGGGVFTQNWMNWWNQDGGTGTYSRTTDGARTVGLFAQTPASSASWAKFQPWNETIDVRGYKYFNFSLKNPGYPDSRVRVIINDGTRSFNVLGGWAEVPTTWTDYKIDMDSFSNVIDKRKARLEVWTRQMGGTYGETLIDDMFFSNDSTGTAPTLTSTSMTANTSGTFNQNTNFTFKTTYTDLDNEPPFAMQVIIDDTAYDMTPMDHGDNTYTDGKDYIYITKLPAGNHSYYFRTTDTTSSEVATAVQSGPNVSYSSQVIDVLVSQAGYSANDYKNAKVTTTEPLVDLSFDVFNGTSVVHAGNMTYEGYFWDKHVYTIDFSTVTATGTNYTVRTNSIASYPFSILTNIWNEYKDEMTAFYRLLRAGVATSDAYPDGYSSIAPSAKLFHEAGHLDDAKSEDGTIHYDLVGGWYDAGDYGQYGGNQWVGTQIALAYIRYADKPSVKYDNDNNGIPDLVDEAIFGSEYLIKFANQLGGAMYNLKNNSSFSHPHKSTDNIPNTSDDRKLQDYGVGGSAKSAATLAATARAIYTAIAEGDIDPADIAALTAFAEECEDAALVFYNYVLNHLDDPHGSYSTRGGISNALLIAEVELYLLTNDTDYLDEATDKVNALTFADLYATNYWDMRPMAMAELYPHADPTTQAHIQDLLKQQVDYFLSSTDDTPYGVLNQFKNFGVNEPHASYLGDLLRYYELFEDPAALRAVLKGMYWIFGENPWNISWVSGIGADFVDFLHTRFDEVANSASATGIVMPGAMVSGPNTKDTRNRISVSPWYEDRSLYEDDTNQWRYNEFSISIQVGLLYTIMGLSTMDNADSSGGTYPVKLPILSPVIGDNVRGEVTIFAKPESALSAVERVSGSSFIPMTSTGGVYTTAVDESASAGYSTKRVDVRGTDSLGNHTISSTQYMVAPPLPDPSSPLIYDDMGGGGLWGSSGGNNQWVNWYSQNGGEATFAKTTEDGRTVGKFTQDPSSTDSRARFQAWHDTFDASGYQYLNFTVKNPNHPDLRMRIELTDGSRTHNLTGGFVSVPSTWTDLKFDLDALPNPVNKDRARIYIWLSQSTAEYGEMFIDEIKATNDASGSAPTLTAGTVDVNSGGTDTDFTFTVTYTDSDNQPPFAVELITDGVIHKMIEVDVNDTTYTDGKDYEYTTKLSLGVHSYYFHTTDTKTDAVSTAVQVGPIVSDNSLLFSDDFNDGNANGWSTTSGTWSVVGGEYNGQASSGNSYAIAGDSGWTDYTLEAKVNVTNNSGGNKDAGLVFRYTDEDNHYVLYLKNNDRSGRKMELVKVVGGVKTTLDHASPSVAADTFYTYKIVANGSSIDVYQDNVLILSATDSAHSSGKIGARTYANTKAIYDDFSVTN